MAKPKSQEQLSEPAQLQSQEPASQESPEALKARIAQLEAEAKEKDAKLQEKDEESLKRVCKASGVSYEDVLDSEKRATTPVEALIAIDMGQHQVNINGRIYRGKVEVPHSVAQVIHQAIGDRRMRHLRELTGSDYLVDGLTTGGGYAKVIGQVNEHGERIGQ